MPKTIISYEELKTKINTNGFNWRVIAEHLEVKQQKVIKVAKRSSKDLSTAKAIQAAAEHPFKEIFGMNEAEYASKCFSRFEVPAEKFESQKAKLAQAPNA